MIYMNQAAKLELSSDDLSGATGARIRYTKPGGQTGYWSAGVTVGGGFVEYQIPNDILDQAGTWTFRPFITYSSGYEYPGEPVTQYVAPYD